MSRKSLTMGIKVFILRFKKQNMPLTNEQGMSHTWRYQLYQYLRTMDQTITHNDVIRWCGAHSWITATNSLEMEVGPKGKLQELRQLIGNEAPTSSVPINQRNSSKNKAPSQRRPARKSKIPLRYVHESDISSPPIPAQSKSKTGPKIIIKNSGIVGSCEFHVTELPNGTIEYNTIWSNVVPTTSMQTNPPSPTANAPHPEHENRNSQTFNATPQNSYINSQTANRNSQSADINPQVANRNLRRSNRNLRRSNRNSQTLNVIPQNEDRNSQISNSISQTLNVTLQDANGNSQTLNPTPQTATTDPQKNPTTSNKPRRSSTIVPEVNVGTSSQNISLINLDETRFYNEDDDENVINFIPSPVLIKVEASATTEQQVPIARQKTLLEIKKETHRILFPPPPVEFKSIEVITLD